MTRKYKTALFPGSFNPFTIGHYSVAERALSIFDRLIIAVGYNENKTSDVNPEERASAIERIFRHTEYSSRVDTVVYSGLTASFAKEQGASAIIRGVRSVADFETERNLADANRKIAGIETLFIPSLPEYGWMSSSAIRELIHFGADVSEFLPDIK